MKNNTYFLSLLIVLSFTFGCTKDDSNSVNANYFIADELQPYFDLFVAAGAERGVDIDLTAAKIEGYLTIISENGVVGQCQYDSKSPHTIRIDRRYWNRANTLEKEYVVLHELGHCYFGREHRDDTASNGFCLSLMESGLGNCRANYKATTRSAYLDELFDYQ